MQTPVSIQEGKGEYNLNYSVFVIETALITFAQLTSDSIFNFATVSAGDPVLSIPNIFSAFKTCDVLTSITPSALIDGSGTLRPIIGDIEYVGATPGVNGPGLYIDGMQSNATFGQRSDALNLNKIPSTLDFSNISAAVRIYSYFDAATFLASPTAGSVHKWRLTINCKIRIK